jgi:hypothetical protein
MKSINTLPEDLSDAMNHFVKKLPDPSKSFYSTIRDEIAVDERKITFMAQKKKGEKGMCWDIRYRISLSKHVAD